MAFDDMSVLVGARRILLALPRLGVTWIHSASIKQT